MKDNQNKKMTLSAEMSNMINKKSYLEQYFKILKDYLKLNIEMSSGNTNENVKEFSQFDDEEDKILNEEDKILNQGKIMDNKDEYSYEVSLGNSNGNSHPNNHIENNSRMNNDHNISQRDNSNSNNNNAMKLHGEKEDDIQDDTEEDDKIIESNPEFLK
jgi:hypothetical protein